MFVFTQLSFFFQHTLYLTRSKKETGRAKQLTNAKYPAFPNLSSLQQYYNSYDEALQPQEQEIDFFWVSYKDGEGKKAC